MSMPQHGSVAGEGARAPSLTKEMRLPDRKPPSLRLPFDPQQECLDPRLLADSGA